MPVRPRWRLLGEMSIVLLNLSVFKVASREARMREDRQQEDMRLVTQLDQKVSDQQVGAFLYIQKMISR